MQNDLSAFMMQLETIFEGDPWYGDSISAILKEITPETAAAKPFPQCHSIIEIAAHMAQWHLLAIKRIEGDNDFNIRQNDPNDWPPVNTGEHDGWPQILQRLYATKEQLIEAVKGKDESFLRRQVAQRNYDFGYLLQGIIQHDLYHGGQLALLKKAGAEV